MTFEEFIAEYGMWVVFFGVVFIGLIYMLKRLGVIA
jgi:hypothetical protein